MNTASPETLRLDRLLVRAKRAFVESGLHGIEAEVVYVVDTSRPLAPRYADGAMQTLTERLLALALCFDDDGVIPAFAFAEEARRLDPLRVDVLKDWVAQTILNTPGPLTDGCCYGPVIHDVCRKYFPLEWTAPVTERKVGGKLKKTVKVYPELQHQRPRPIFVLFITGGDCQDPANTINAIRRASHLPIFFQFAGITSRDAGAKPHFGFLKTLDSLTDTHVDNCGFFEADARVDVEALFQGLLNEFPQYIARPEVAAMLLPPPEPDIESSLDSGIDDALLAPTPEEVARHEADREARRRRRRMRQIEARRSAGEPLDADDIAALVDALAAGDGGDQGDDDTVETGGGGPEPPEDAVERLRRIRARREARRLLDGDDA